MFEFPTDVGLLSFRFVRTYLSDVSKSSSVLSDQLGLSAVEETLVGCLDRSPVSGSSPLPPLVFSSLPSFPRSLSFHEIVGRRYWVRGIEGKSEDVGESRTYRRYKNICLSRFFSPLFLFLRGSLTLRG